MKKTITELLLDSSVQKIEKRELQRLKGRKNYSRWKKYFPSTDIPYVQKINTGIRTSLSE